MEPSKDSLLLSLKYYRCLWSLCQECVLQNLITEFSTSSRFCATPCPHANDRKVCFKDIYKVQSKLKQQLF